MFYHPGACDAMDCTVLYCCGAARRGSATLPSNIDADADADADAAE